jgi:hypothetical protein
MNLDDLDTMIMDADPALDLEIPSGVSLGAQRSYVQMTSLPPRVGGDRRPFVLATSVVGAVAAALIILIVTLVAIPSGQQSAAAAVLLQAATKAGEQRINLTAGQYLYSETRALYRVIVYVPSASGTLVEGPRAQFIETNRVWINARDNGRVLRAQGPLRFPSARDRAEWDASPAGQRVYQSLPTGSLAQGQTRPRQSLVNLSDLPTEPSRLESVLRNDEFHTNVDDIPQSPDAVFERSAILLLGPDLGMSPALASALFHVLANQRGARLVGDVTAHSGRRGIGVTLVTGETGNVSEVVVNLKTGSLLEASFATPASTVSPSPGRGCMSPNDEPPSCPGKTTFATLAPIWTDLVSSGIVPSDTATPPRS